MGFRILDISLDIFDPWFRHFWVVENYEICLRIFDKLRNPVKSVVDELWM